MIKLTKKTPYQLYSNNQNLNKQIFNSHHVKLTKHEKHFKKQKFSFPEFFSKYIYTTKQKQCFVPNKFNNIRSFKEASQNEIQADFEYNYRLARFNQSSKSVKLNQKGMDSGSTKQSIFSSKQLILAFANNSEQKQNFCSRINIYKNKEIQKNSIQMLMSKEYQEKSPSFGNYRKSEAKENNFNKQRYFILNNGLTSSNTKHKPFRELFPQTQ